MHYIGIDLTWTYTKESGICIIDEFGKIVYCELGIQAMSKKEFKNLEDKLDAFLCAYAANWLAKNEGKVIDDDQEGFIALPVIDGNSAHVAGSRGVKVYNKLIRDKIWRFERSRRIRRACTHKVY